MSAPTAAPEVTVVVATYNWPSVLRIALESALEQTFEDFELLVVGDACTDETAEVVEEFADPRVRWVNLIENLGNQADVYRAALPQVRSPLIAYLNHDDIWFPDHLEIVRGALRRNRVDLAHSIALRIPPDDAMDRMLIGMPHRSREGDRVVSWVTTSNAIHDAEAARAAGGWRGWREIEEEPPFEFFTRLKGLRNSYAVAPFITTLKFHSAARPGSYRARRADEQIAWRARMKAEPDLRHREYAMAMACLRFDELPETKGHVGPKADAPKGWRIEHLRRLRGLEPRLDLGEALEAAEAARPERPPEHSTEAQEKPRFIRLGPGYRFAVTPPDLERTAED